MNTSHRITGMFLVLFAVTGLPGTVWGEDEVSVQGTEIVDRMIEELSLLEAGIHEESKEAAIDHVNVLEAQLNRYVEHNNVLYAGEISPPEGLAGVLEQVPGMIADLRSMLMDEVYADALETAQAISQQVERLREIIGITVLFDFTGMKCKACKVMKTRLNAIMLEYLNRVRIVLVDVNSQKDLTREYKIMLIPTLIFIDSSGVEVARHTGEMEEFAIKEKLAELLGE